MFAVMNDPEIPFAECTADVQHQPVQTVVRGRPFLPGQSGNVKGRPKGSRNLFAEDFLADFHDAWTKHGQNALLLMAIEKPTEFVNAAVKILPRMVEINDPVGELDRDLTGTILEFIRARTVGLRAAIDGASGQTQESDPPSGLPALPAAD